MINIKIIKVKQKKLIKELRSTFEKNNIYLKLEKLNSRILDVNFWRDKNNSSKIIKEKKLYEDLIKSYSDSIETLVDLNDLNELALEENNQTVQKEIIQNIKELKKIVKKMRLSAFYLMILTHQIVIQKFMLELAEPKAKTGLTC